MKRLLLLFVVLFLFLFTVTIIAQKDGSIGKSIEYSFPEKIQRPMGEPLPAGTYSIGSGGYFTTIQSAFDKLSTDGVAGAVNLELIDNLYTAPTDSFGFLLNGPIPGAGLNSRVTIKPAENKNVTIQGDGFGTITFLNTSYVTVDGTNLTGATTLTMHTLSNSTFLYNESIVFFNNCDHNVMQNITFINEDITRISGSCFWGNNTSSEAPDSNLIQNNFVKQAGIGFFISVDYTTVRGIGNIIRGNKVGSETDSLIAWGIQVENCQNSIIEDNIVQNLRFYNNYSNPGINSMWGNGDIIRNNVVHNIHASGGIFGGMGILLSGSAGKPGSNNLVYNNMVYDIRSSSTVPQSTVAGIQMWQQINPKIYYNSVYLNGNGNGANSDGSAALYIYYACTNVEAKDNILVNIRDESPYCASAIYDNTIANLTSDYNDLFYEQSQYSALVRIGGTKYNTLAYWQATGKDIHSITEMPPFISPDLHINLNSLTLLDRNATPINGISTDIDGELRSGEIPDIGADEFAPTIFALLVNVSDGWNMVSIPGLHPVDQNVDTWWAFKDPAANVFKYVGGYQAVTAATPGTGYWMKHAGARTYNTGDEWPAGGIQIVPHDPLAGASGWNLIGGYDLSVNAANVTTIPAGLQSGPIYKYSSGYQVATTLDPGYGYWIKLLSAAQIIIPETLAKGEASVEYFPDDWGRIVLTDATGINYTLYAVKGETDLSQYELPPAPPTGMFDIRYSSGRIAEDLSSAIQIIEMQGITYPIDVRTEGLTIILQDETGKIVNDAVSPGEALTINNSLVNKLVILSAEVGKNIPTVYSLEQNYPNPFNPNTIISYQLPLSSNVSLIVYDILGNELMMLIDEFKNAGKYQVEFNAAKLASGVYFYRLKAGEFISTKKMLLLK